MIELYISMAIVIITIVISYYNNRKKSVPSLMQVLTQIKDRDLLIISGRLGHMAKDLTDIRAIVNQVNDYILASKIDLTETKLISFQLGEKITEYASDERDREQAVLLQLSGIKIELQNIAHKIELLERTIKE